MLCLALGGVCFQVVIGDREDEEERLTLAVLCFHLGCCVLVLDGLYACLFPSLVMLVGGVVCHPGAVLESVASGVIRGWCQGVSVVSCSWRCVFAGCDWREKMK